LRGNTTSPSEEKPRLVIRDIVPEDLEEINLENASIGTSTSDSTFKFDFGAYLCKMAGNADDKPMSGNDATTKRFSDDIAHEDNSVRPLNQLVDIHETAASKSPRQRSTPGHDSIRFNPSRKANISFNASPESNPPSTFPRYMPPHKVASPGKFHAYVPSQKLALQADKSVPFDFRAEDFPSLPPSQVSSTVSTSKRKKNLREKVKGYPFGIVPEDEANEATPAVKAASLELPEKTPVAPSVNTMSSAFHDSVAENGGTHAMINSKDDIQQKLSPSVKDFENENGVSWKSTDTNAKAGKVDLGTPINVRD
jgi:hypothetical protein